MNYALHLLVLYELYLILTISLNLVVAYCGMLSAALLSLLVSFPSLRLRGDYFVLASLGFQIILSIVLLNWIVVTKGPYGVADVPRPTLGGMTAHSTTSILAICTIALAGIRHEVTF